MKAPAKVRGETRKAQGNHFGPIAQEQEECKRQVQITPNEKRKREMKTRAAGREGRWDEKNEWRKRNLEKEVKKGGGGIHRPKKG